LDTVLATNVDRSRAILGEEDPLLMAAIAASYASGNPRLHGQSEEELEAAAVRRSMMEEDNRQRAMLREEQAAEYEESLRIDREREAGKALRQKEEEEASRIQAAEEEGKRREAEQRRQEAEAAEKAKKAKIDARVQQASEQLLPEPPAEEPGRVDVLIKAPDGRRLTRAFRAKDPLLQVYHYVNVHACEALAGQEFRLVSTMPRAVYEDASVTLEDSGLKGRCALLVEVLDD